MRKLLLLSLLAILSIGTAMAQGVTNASMNGKITDKEGEPLIGANVVAVHTPTGTMYGGVTDVTGFYRIINMRVGGPYKITVSYTGYADFVKENAYLKLGQSFQFSVPLDESAIDLVGVEVIASRGDVFDGNRTGAETTITEEQINSLPTLARAIGDFTRLTPQARVQEGGDGYSISLNGMNNRYNAIYIDGAINNDVFGLAGSGTNGGQTGVSPVSLDAIEEFQISLAPFDVKVGGFAGGAINAVTRSGTNNFEGSAYTFFRNQSLAGLTPTDNETVERTRLNDYTAQTTGFRIGGPLIKNKLFFFVNAEIQRDETPEPFQFEDYEGDASLADLEALRDKLINQFGYTPGTFTDNRSFLESDKVNVKLDYNISQGNTLSFRYGYVGARNLEGVQSSTRRIRFLNESEFFNSRTNSAVLEWNSVIGSKYANNLVVGLTSVRDDRDPYQGDDQRDESDNPNYFPYVSITDGAGRITFGSEQFSTANALDQDVLTITDNFNIYAGKHNITLGTHNEFYSVYNLFIRQNFGAYEYDRPGNNNLQDFMNDSTATEYVRSYSLVDNITGDGSAAAAEFSGAQFGLYAQDEYQATENFKVTLGLRLDIPVYFTDVRTNDDFNNTTVAALEAAGYDLMGAEVGAFIDPQFLLAPRLGFNWDVNGKNKTQVRGGVGIFNSRIPLVWPGGAFNNNGLSVGGDFNGSPDFGVADNPNWNQQPQNVQPGAGDPSGQIDLFAADFKPVQVLKANVILDQKLPWGLVGNIDLLFNKTLRNVAYQNLNLKPSTSNLTGTPDDRPIYDRRDEIDDSYTRILLGYNTSDGYTYNFTASLTKEFTKGFSGFVAYSYGDAFSVFDGTSSQNSSQWRGLHAINGRNFDQVSSRSDFSAGSRVISALSYRIDEGDNAATTISLFFEGVQGNPYSYIYNDGGRLNNEDSRERNLIYIPNDASEINLIDDANAGTAAAQWTALNEYIDGSEYLSSRRGQYAERNQTRAPWQGVLDAKLMQDIMIEAGGKNHQLQLTLDVFNLTNMINPNWGRRYLRGSFGNVELLNFEGFQADGTTPEFTFDGAPADFIDDSGLQSSRWQMQIGVRYIFN